MADREATAPPASPRFGWRRAALAIALVGVLALAIAGGVVLGRATAPGPNLVVVPGPVVQEPAAIDPLATSGLLDADRLVVAAGSVSPPAVFTASPDLDDAKGTASGYRLTRSGLDGSAVAEGLATVFGAEGEVVRTSEGWTVGGQDGSAPMLAVLDDPALSWTFADPAAAAEAEGGVFVAPRRAKEVAAALLSGVGVDLDSVDWQVSRFDDHLAVVATQVVDGHRTSLSWQVSFGQNDSVVFASGFSAELVEVPGYDLVGAATAVRRAGLPTWSLLGPTPVISSESRPPVSVPGPVPATGAGERPVLEVGVSSIVITDSTLGLAQFWQPDGALLVLPAYELTGDDGSLWTLIAVSGDDIDFVDQPYPGLSPPVP